MPMRLDKCSTRSIAASASLPRRCGVHGCRGGPNVGLVGNPGGTDRRSPDQTSRIGSGADAQVAASVRRRCSALCDTSAPLRTRPKGACRLPAQARFRSFAQATSDFADCYAESGKAGDGPRTVCQRSAPSRSLIGQRPRPKSGHQRVGARRHICAKEQSLRQIWKPDICSAGHARFRVSLKNQPEGKLYVDTSPPALDRRCRPLYASKLRPAQSNRQCRSAAVLRRFSPPIERAAASHDPT